MEIKVEMEEDGDNVIYLGTMEMDADEQIEFMQKILTYSQETGKSIDEVVSELKVERQQIVDAQTRRYLEYITEIIPPGTFPEFKRANLQISRHSGWGGNRIVAMAVDEISFDVETSSTNVDFAKLDPDTAKSYLPTPEEIDMGIRNLDVLTQSNGCTFTTYSGKVCGLPPEADVHQHAHYGHDYQKD